MGKYNRAKPPVQRSLNDALREAEQDHFVDCHNADIFVRLEALVIDVIFLGLLSSGLDRILSVLVAYFAFQQNESLEPMEVLAHSFKIALQGLLFYLYWIKSTTEFGATPGKLLLKLRVVDIDSGERLSFRQAILRELLGKILSFLPLGAGFWVAVYRDDSRALHDLLSRSVVKTLIHKP